MMNELPRLLREAQVSVKMPDGTIRLVNHLAAERIEQLEAEVSTARRTSNYWKMEHLEGNKRIEQLEAALKWIVDSDPAVLRSADFHTSCKCHRCAMDNARAALAEENE